MARQVVRTYNYTHSACEVQVQQLAGQQPAGPSLLHVDLAWCLRTCCCHKIWDDNHDMTNSMNHHVAVELVAPLAPTPGGTRFDPLESGNTTYEDMTWQESWRSHLLTPVQYPHEYWLVQYHFVCQGASALAMGQCEMAGERGARLPAKNFPQMAGYIRHIDSGPKHTMHTMHTSNLYTCQLGCVYAFPVRPDKTKMHWFSLHPIPAIQYQSLIEWKSAWWTRGEGFWLPARWIRRKSDAWHNSSTKNTKKI